MAQVDFSNAVLSISTTNPLAYYYTGFSSDTSGNPNRILNQSGQEITSSRSLTKNVTSKNKLIMTMSGTFSESGTEFYIAYYPNYFWKVSNITFASGDTFTFQVTVDLVTS